MRVVPELVGERGEPSTPPMAPSLELLDMGRSEREDGVRPGGKEDGDEENGYAYNSIFSLT